MTPDEMADDERQFVSWLYLCEKLASVYEH